MEFEELLSGCKLKNPKHQSKLYNMFYRVICTTCKSYVKNQEEAEDLSQEIILKIFEKINSFNGEKVEQLNSWVKRIAKNYTIDTIRKQKVKIEYFDNNDYAFSIDDDLTITLFDDNDKPSMNQINDAINKLSPKYKTVFQLYYLDNLSHVEISEKLNINVGTSKSNLAKARGKVAKYLTEC